MKIALVTCQSMGDYNNNVESEDELLSRYLKDKGLDVTFEVWDDPQVAWEAYGAVVVKSPWDYFDQADAFYDWLAEMERRDIRMLNPAAVIRWNADKVYLRDIAEAGFPVVPTVWLNKGDRLEAKQLFGELQTEKIIVKPRVSGGSKNTFALERAEAERLSEKLNSLFAEEGFMAQPFLAEVPAKGEWSFVFFRGKFSHAVLKKAKAGDFRVQHYLGGTIEPREAPAHLLEQASRLARHYARDCLYARVDGVEVGEQLLLMELELIEPFLFLFTHPASFEAYYTALQQLLVQPPSSSRRSAF
jgi:glutathione synthase/RimK-type ligase-like ATP-grasp enzyme